MIPHEWDHMLRGQKARTLSDRKRGNQVAYTSFCIYALKQIKWCSEVQFRLINQIGKPDWMINVMHKYLYESMLVH